MCARCHCGRVGFLKTCAPFSVTSLKNVRMAKANSLRAGPGTMRRCYVKLWIRSHPRHFPGPSKPSVSLRSEEHTSELQSLAYLVCRLLLEKKKKQLTYRLRVLY